MVRNSNRLSLECSVMKVQYLYKSNIVVSAAKRILMTILWTRANMKPTIKCGQEGRILCLVINQIVDLCRLLLMIEIEMKQCEFRVSLILQGVY